MLDVQQVLEYLEAPQLLFHCGQLSNGWILRDRPTSPEMARSRMLRVEYKVNGCGAGLLGHGGCGGCGGRGKICGRM